MKDQGLIKGRAASRPHNPHRCQRRLNHLLLRCSDVWSISHANPHASLQQLVRAWGCTPTHILLMLLDLSSLDLQHLVQDTLTPRHHPALSHFALHSSTHVHATHVTMSPNPHEVSAPQLQRIFHGSLRCRPAPNPAVYHGLKFIFMTILMFLTKPVITWGALLHCWNDPHTILLVVFSPYIPWCPQNMSCFLPQLSPQFLLI